jgi:hypothetical protein
MLERRVVVAMVGAVAMALVAPRARADEPSPDRVRAAAEEYDKGRRMYLAGDYDSAATHFENAWRDAPRGETLRSAIRARVSAKQPARAATLAAYAQVKYASEAPILETANKTLADAGPTLFALTVKCTPECAVLSDARLASLTESTQQTIYLDPGAHDVVVAWSGDRSEKRKVTAKAGAKEELVLQAPPMPVKPPPPPPAQPPTSPPPDKREVATKPLPPIVTYVGAGLTVVAGGITIWSGVDTLNNPGKDAVRRDCVGQDESCSTYQKGRSAQLRTNILIGVTAGLGVATGVIAIFFTQWSTPNPKPKTGVNVAPWMQVGAALPDRGVPTIGGVEGTF